MQKIIRVSWKVNFVAKYANILFNMVKNESYLIRNANAKKVRN